MPGVMTYGVTRTDAVAKGQDLALRALAEPMEAGEAVPELLTVSAPEGFPVPWPSPPARWLEAARAIGEEASLTVDDVALYLLASEQGPVQ